MSNKVKIPYEAFLSDNPESRIFADLRQLVSIVYQGLMKSSVSDERLDDFVQEVVCCLYDGALSKFDPKKGHKFSNWLYTVIRNTIVDYHNDYEQLSDAVRIDFLMNGREVLLKSPASKKAKVKKNAQPAEEEQENYIIYECRTSKVDEDYFSCRQYGDTVEEAEEEYKAQRREIFHQSVSTLTAHRQKILEMYAQNVPSKEIARKMNMTVNAVNACICNTKKTLKKKVEVLLSEQKMAA